LSFGKKEMKSSRHSKIAGDFGEMIVLYYLSRYGFECARIDHTGIDLLARSANESRPRGITVKTASRIDARKGKPSRQPLGLLDEATRACVPFNANPYLAIVFDGIERICILLQSVEDIRKEQAGSKTLSFRFRDADCIRYAQPDFSGMFIEMSVSIRSWAKEPNKPHAANPARTSSLQTRGQRRGVADGRR
jgi:hypothetical protein